MRLPKRRRGQRNSTPADIIHAVRQLALIASDDLIAGLLNRNGLKTGNGNRWTRERVTSMRSSYRIPVFKPAQDGIEPWLNLGDAARVLKIAPKTLRLAAEVGEIEFHPSSAGWSLDLCPRCSRDVRRSIHHKTRAVEPKIPRGIASRPAKPLLFNPIARWVFPCAVVGFDPGVQVGLQVRDRTVDLLSEGDAVELVERGLVEAFDDAVIRYEIRGALLSGCSRKGTAIW